MIVLLILYLKCDPGIKTLPNINFCVNRILNLDVLFQDMFAKLGSNATGYDEIDTQNVYILQE